MKKTKKFGLGGYTQKPIVGPIKPMGPIMGPKSTDSSGVMSGLKNMASSLKPNMVTEKPNMGPNASTNQTQGSPLKGFSAGFDPTKPRPVSSGKLYPLQGSISPVKGPAATPVGLMGGSSNKMGPDSMKTGVPSNPANMSIAKPPGLTGAGVTKFTGPPIIKTAKNFEGLTPGGRPIVNPNNPAVQKFTGPMSKGPRFDKPPKPLTTPTSNPNVLKFNGPMVQSKLKAGGTTKMAKGGGIESKGKTKGAMVRMKSGGRSC